MSSQPVERGRLLLPLLQFLEMVLVLQDVLLAAGGAICICGRSGSSAIGDGSAAAGAASPEPSSAEG